MPFRRLYPRWLMNGRTATEPGESDVPASPFTFDLMNPLSWITAARKLRNIKPDVLLIAYWSGVLAPLCALMRRASGLPTFVLLHNFTSHEPISGESMLKRMLVSSSDGFITLSQTVESELRAFAPAAKTLRLFHPLYERQTPIIRPIRLSRPFPAASSLKKAKPATLSAMTPKRRCCSFSATFGNTRALTPCSKRWRLCFNASRRRGLSWPGSSFSAHRVFGKRPDGSVSMARSNSAKGTCPLVRSLR